MWIRVLFVVLFIESSYAFSGGAGSSACITMTPSHQNTPAQTSDPPFRIVQTVNNILQGQSMTFVVEGINPDFLFRGFLAQVRSLNDEAELIGSFIYTDTQRMVNCQTPVPANSVATHTSNADKSRIELTWVAPTDFTGMVRLLVSVVQEFTIFWTLVPSNFVLISEDPNATPPNPEDINVYEGCGESGKVCFGSPAGCVDSENCRLFGSVSHQNERFYFELLSKSGVAYTAMALSDDNRMGDDSVIECVNNQGEVEAFTSYNEGHEGASRYNVDQDIITLVASHLIDGDIYCRVERQANATVRGKVFDMINDKHFLLLASGMNVFDDSIGPHTIPAASDEALWLNSNPPSPPIDETPSEIYEGCGTTKICVGFPSGCIFGGSCSLFGAVIYESDRFYFELFSSVGVAYTAIGLSFNTNMGDSSVIECVNNNGVVTAFTSYTEGHDGSPRTNINQNIIRLEDWRIENGNIYCLVERNALTTVRDVEFDLINDEFHLLLASGNEAGTNAVGHHELAIASDERVSLTIPRNLEASQRVLIKVHGVLMIIAWIGTASLGIFMARYFKKTWVDQTISGKQAWFLWHFICMVLTFVLTIASVIIIFVEIGEWRTSVHSLCGIIVTTFVILQPLGAVFRPDPTSKHRPVFNFLHLSFGNITHILAIITIFFAVPLSNARLPKWTSYILITFVVLYLLMHVLMTTIRIFGEIKREEKLGSNKKAPYMVLNKTLLGLFVITTLLFVIALICILFLVDP